MQIIVFDISDKMQNYLQVVITYMYSTQFIRKQRMLKGAII